MRLVVAALLLTIASTALAGEYSTAPDERRVWATNYPAMLSERPLALPLGLTDLGQSMWLAGLGGRPESALGGTTTARRGFGDGLELGVSVPLGLTGGPELGDLLANLVLQIEASYALIAHLGPSAGFAFQMGGLPMGAGSSLLPSYRGLTAGAGCRWKANLGMPSLAFLGDIDMGAVWWTDAALRTVVQFRLPLAFQFSAGEHVGVQVGALGFLDIEAVDGGNAQGGVDGSVGLFYTDPVIDLGITAAPSLFPQLFGRWSVSTHLAVRLPL